MGTPRQSVLRFKTVGFNDTYTTEYFEDISIANVGDNAGTAGGNITITNSIGEIIEIPYGMGIDASQLSNAGAPLNIATPVDAKCLILWT